MAEKIIITTATELAEIIQNSISVEIQKAISFFNPPIANKTSTSDFCLITEASQITGLSESTIRTKCHFGELPYFKPPGTKMLQFKRSELVSWIASGRVKTNNELEHENNQYLTSKRRKNGK